MKISDSIENYLLELITSSSDEVFIQRNELALLFHCVPSQINYVISTRFSPEHGFIVESTRGGGGGIKIKRIKATKKNATMHIINSIENSISQHEAFVYIKNMLNLELISEHEANLIIGAINDRSLPLPQPLKDSIRAQIFKNILIKLI